MNTKLLTSSLAAAVAVACAGSAFAVNLSSFNEGSASQVTLRSAGSTAHDPGLLNLLRLTTTGSQFCAPGSLDVYQMNSNLNVYFCTAGAASGVSGKNLAVLRNGSFGSGSGVSTLVRGTTTVLDITGASITSTFPDVSAGATISAAATSTIAGSGQLSSYLLHGGIPVATTTAVADMSITDEEPSLFKDVFSPKVSSTEIAKLSTTGISGVIFGTPVTRDIYGRLQALQFATTSSCHPSNAGYGTLSAGAADAANSEACMPSLSREQIAAIFKGDITDWSGISGANNAVDTVADVAPFGALADTGVYIERRVPTSGTQLAAQNYYLSTNCVDGAATPFDAASDGVHVRERAGSGDVRNGLAADNDAGLGAIGVLSTESATVPSTKWRFVKINGYAPSLLNVVKGNYDFFYESTINWRNTSVGGVVALSGTKLTAAGNIGKLLGNPVSVAGLDGGFGQVFGARGGLLANAIDQAANAPTIPYAVPGSGGTGDVNVRPVATSTRAVTGSPNACVNPVRIGQIQAGN